jgi:hypothetical protein
MCEIKERSIFIHIDVPGHEDNAPDLPDRCVCVEKQGTSSLSRISFQVQKLTMQLKKYFARKITSSCHIRYFMTDRY